MCQRLVAAAAVKNIAKNDIAAFKYTQKSITGRNVYHIGNFKMTGLLSSSSCKETPPIDTS